MNLYTYCANEPLMYFDPSGHSGIGSVWNSLSNGAKAVGNAIWEGAISLYQGAGKIADGTVRTASNIASATGTAIKSATNYISKVAKNLANEVQNVTASVGKSINNLGSEVFSGVKKSLSSFKEIGASILSASNDRFNAALNSPKDFANFLTMGIPKGIYDDLNNKYETMQQDLTLYNVADWATMGLVSTAKGAVAPKEALSAEHWANSFALALIMVPAAQAASKSIKVPSFKNAGIVESETFYRTMSKADYENLVKTGKVPATNETFISPTKSFSEGYNGVTVEVKVKAGTTKELASVGVRDSSNIVRNAYGNMPTVNKGWNINNAFFKGENGQINIGLGTGTALDVFNNSILKSKVVGGK